MPIYSKVNTPMDISRINCIIRDEMMVVEDEAKLSELKKRSDYLCTLTFSPFWKKRFADKIEEFKEVAILENRVTVKEANILSKYKGFDKSYSPWKKEIDITKELEKIPQQILDEIANSAFSLEFDVEVLEDIRVLFCDIRKALILCEDEECVKKLKRGVDILSVLPYLDSFVTHFEKEVLKDIDELIGIEKKRSIELINIICEVNSWQSYFEVLDVENEEQSNEILKDLLEEEEKASTYIPTEQKYKGGANVLWLVYFHPNRKREYAKRVYFPSEFKDLKIKGPGEFENKFGNKVWGVLLEYKSKVEKTTIKVRGKEITLPERWVKRKKIVLLPKEAKDVRLLTKKPESAMDIA